MIEFGKTLRAAREAKGLTIGQIADMTHMTPNAVSELENENFSHLPAPIYGRGFVKLYCSAVGLDPKPLLEEFMEIFNGNRSINIKERAIAENPVPRVKEEEPADEGTPEDPVPDAPTPADPEIEEPIAPVPPPVEPLGVLSQQDFFNKEPEPINPLPRPSFAPKPEPPVQSAAAAPLPPSAPTSAERTVSRYSTPIDEPQARLSPGVPPYIRLGVLAMLAVIVLALLVLGIRSLYRTTAPSTPETPAPVAKAEAAPVPTASAKSAPKAAKSAPSNATKPVAKKPASNVRTPQKIPALYVD